MIIVVAGIKGGSGKTTLATNLTVMRSLSGKDVLLVDTDYQESASDFTFLRNQETGDKAGYSFMILSDEHVRAEIRNQARKWDDIIIDVPGKDSASQRAALTVADVALIPFNPRSFDVWTIGKCAQLIKEARSINETLRAYCFLNRADPSGQDNEATQEILGGTHGGIEFIDFPLGNRKAFARAASQGLAVTELKPVDTKAKDEIMALHDFVFRQNDTSMIPV
jgi:chromosome partitioning protein